MMRSYEDNAKVGFSVIEKSVSSPQVPYVSFPEKAYVSETTEAPNFGSNSRYDETDAHERFGNRTRKPRVCCCTYWGV
jgi:hypothetical protein